MTADAGWIKLFLEAELSAAHDRFNACSQLCGLITIYRLTGVQGRTRKSKVASLQSRKHFAIIHDIGEISDILDLPPDSWEL